MNINLTLEEMKEKYYKKSGKAHIEDYLSIWYSENVGFFSYQIIETEEGNILMVPDAFGNGIELYKEAELLARENKCIKLLGGTTRAPKLYTEKYGFKIVGYILEKELSWE
jgi:hypothetical protein